MLPLTRTIQPPHAPAPSRRARSALGAAATVLVAASAGAACSKSEPQFEELRGWDRVALHPHPDVIPYDRVATAAGPDGVAWLTWATGSDDVLAYRQAPGGGEVEEVELPAPHSPVLIPLGVATDGPGWVAVAATRDRPVGENTGLIAWQASRPTAGGTEAAAGAPGPSGGSPAAGPAAAADATTPTDAGGPTGGGEPTGSGEPASAPAAGELLDMPAGVVGPLQTVNAGLAGPVAVVAGVSGGRAVIWTSRDGGPWEAAVPDLGLDAELAAVDLVGHRGALVLAGVGADGGAHLWTSPDGDVWEAGPGDLPSDVRSVTLLAPLDDDELALAWLAGGPDDAGPRSGTTATVQRFDGRRVFDEGTIEARPDDGIPTLSLDGAARSPDGNLVVVGTAAPATGTGVPMIWLRDGDAWAPSTQRELAGRLDHQFRAVATTDDGGMVGLITPATHVDVEVWRWSPAG